MAEHMLFTVFPYLAFSLAIVGGVYRYFADRFSYSSLSSQFLENRTLFWGSVPFHYGMVIILLAHLLAVLFRQLWASLLSDPARLLTLELVGMALGFFTLCGLILLIIRRLGNSKVRAVTSVLDWMLLGTLTAQVASGIFIALYYRWGSLWYLDTAVPWLRSIARLGPNISTISPLPWMVKFHAFNALVIIALFPFTRLVHIFSIPLTYLWRPYQVVIWNRRPAKWPGLVEGKGVLYPLIDTQTEATRRDFMKLATGVLTILTGLVIGIPILGTLVGPIFRREKAKWIKVAEVKSLTLGQPQKLTFASLTVDAYIMETVLHSVWVVKHSPSEVSAFSSVCPHLGCHYNWNPQSKHFECPCHNSVYAVNGQVLGGPAPRPLDTLPTNVEDGGLFIQWMEFKVGIPEKISV